MRKHTGEKFSCDLCKFETYCPKRLKAHKINIHIGEEKKFKCEFCSYENSKLAPLNDHIRYSGSMDNNFVPRFLINEIERTNLSEQSIDP